MKQVISLLSCLLLWVATLSGQTRSSNIKALNNYTLAANAHMQALTACITSLERYDGLFHDFIRTQRQLGGEPYEKPKSSPFKDEDMFDIGSDDPATLYNAALKGATVLPADARTRLNHSLTGISNCGKSIVTLIDSMSNAFHGPLITVTTDSTLLPYRLLYAARRELWTCKQHRDDLFSGLQDHAARNCPLNAPAGDYIHSAESLRVGIGLCQDLLNDFRSRALPANHRRSQMLDSLCDELWQNELKHLKGITPIGKSSKFPNEGNYNGFDLYSKYEEIVMQMKVFRALGEKYASVAEKGQDFTKTSQAIFNDALGRFNGIAGMIHDYNEYTILIGGGKMKILMDNLGKAKYVLKGWSDGSRTLPVRPLLLWMWDVPVFEGL